jgi:hypothetical protein
MRLTPDAAKIARFQNPLSNPTWARHVTFGDDFIVYLAYNTKKPLLRLTSDVDYWKDAIRNLMDSIMSNGTWEVVDCPYGCKLVDASECARRSLCLMVLLKNIRQGLWPRITPEMKVKISLILTHLLPD